MTKFFIRLPAVPSAPPLRLRGGVWSSRVPWVPWEALDCRLCREELYTHCWDCWRATATLGMGLRLPLRRSTSFTPDHPALMEVPGPTALKMEANVLVMGADNVGKSALTVRFLTRRFIGEYGDMEFIYSHNVTVDGREILFHIWDAPNSQEQTEDGSSEEKRIQWADSFVLVYSICDRASFNILPLKIQFIKAAKEGQSQEKVPIVIVGNKRDLHHQRVVTSEEGRLLALSLDCGFYEVSAAEAYHGALMVFHGLAKRIPDTKLALKKGTGIRGIVKTMSAVFTRKRTDSL
ncbi:ras-related and estrogen-regulated growth inhibitor-like protein [Neopelma chrysocephalum]|uniref:ras-related and estrogen-regulated growth inhibitor-like protein n=1 Tax=Neopelma chrysocephalum TaxID=114329 RepID=UPI000FCCED5D|nr:ras-related and estrogen-regulated growth inhibitor-like protein [Neopelma chrysocephalum]